MLELSLLDFLNLVDRGFLPRGLDIGGGKIRWDVDALRAVARGDIQSLLDEGRINRIVLERK